MQTYELGERVIAALFEENFGNPHVRRLRITERAFDAIVTSALGEEPRS